MRTGELSAAGSPPQAADSDVTRQLCTALYSRPAHAVGPVPLGEARLLRLVGAVLRDPARSVPSYGFDLVPVLTHGVRARRWRRIRQVAVVVLLGLVVAWAPLPALTWLGALGAAWVLGPSGAVWALLPLIGYWLFALVATGKYENRHELWIRSLQLPFLVVVAVALVYVVDAIVARSARKRAGRDGGTRDRLPSVGPRTRGRVAWADTRQNGTALPYDVQGRFIGAGRATRGAVEMRVPLRPAPAGPGRPVVALRETELLESIAAALTATGHGEGSTGDPSETAPLPGFSVAQVLALPAGLWLERNRGRNLTGAGAPDPADSLGRPERPYLRARCVSWGGQLVVSLFVHAALQAGELRLTLRPQVMAPLLPLPEPAGPVVLDGLRGAAGLWLVLWRWMLKTRAPETDSAGPDTPLSLRDSLSLPEISDLHQSGDAERHIELMQAAVLGAVEALLERHGLATEAFSDRRTVINSIQVLGDNNAGIQLAGGVTLTQVAQTAPTPGPAPIPVQAPDPASASASTEGVLMSPGFPRRDPSPDPAQTPGSGINIGGDNTGTAQNAVGHRLSHVTQTGTGQGSVPLDTVAALLTAFRADIDRNAALLADPDALRDQTTVLAGTLSAPESDGFRPALRVAARALPGLVIGTAVQHTGEALVTAIRELLS